MSENETIQGFYSQSQTISKIAPALLKAQRIIGAAKKDSVNPFFKAKYADLGSVMEVCKDPLNENGIAILQPIVSNGVGVYVLTTLLHESGEFISSQLRIAAKNEHDPQAQGSAITYARRYALQSMLSIPVEDDDGEGAMKRNEPVERAATESAGKSMGAAANASGEALTFIPQAVLNREKTKSGKLGPYKIVMPKGEMLGTFDPLAYTIAKGAMEKRMEVSVIVEKTQYGMNAKEVRLANAELIDETEPAEVYP